MNRSNLVFVLIAIFIVSIRGMSQDRIKLRAGLSGTGTYDEGLWYFKSATGLGPQKFTFQNSWGLGVDAEYMITERMAAGAHLSWTKTGFELEIDNGAGFQISKDPTSHNQVIAEVKHIGRPGKRFRPFVGANAGILFTRDIQLNIGLEKIEFEFINPFIYGFVLGFDHEIGKQGFGIHIVMRGQYFEYTTLPTTVTNRQTLLDQVWWMNYNHLQWGITKTLN